MRELSDKSDCSPHVANSPAATPTGDVAHLDYRQKTNLGSFYTPPHLVRLLYTILAKCAPSNFADVVLEPACGYGAFFSENFPQANARMVGADIDHDALAIGQRDFSHVTFYSHSALTSIGREKYGISPTERLVIVGNPPYNDVTSHAKNKIKAAPCKMDPAIKTRDLGLSFMLAFTKLQPDYIAVLHPLSYLIKKANFRALAPLMQNYSLCDAIVFNSQEFSDTSKASGFPIVAAVYKKSEIGTSYEQIYQKKFHTIEGATFSLSSYDYICRYIKKYPTSRTADVPDSSHYCFFTMRDINALKRSRTFIQEDTANTIHIAPAKLHYYCYVDAFKDIAATLPYYLGNFDIMFDPAAFEPLKDDFLTLSIAKHPAIFQPAFPRPAPERLRLATQRVQNYFRQLFHVASLKKDGRTRSLAKARAAPKTTQGCPKNSG